MRLKLHNSAILSVVPTFLLPLIAFGTARIVYEDPNYGYCNKWAKHLEEVYHIVTTIDTKLR